MIRSFVLVALVSAVGFVALAADEARACGGLFCSTQSPTPVDQNAERILFRVHEDQRVTAIVEISYTGDPRDFSWIIPVPDTPVVEVVPAGALRVLDQATGPQITPPPTTCASSGVPSIPLGFACAEPVMAVDRSPTGGDSSDVDVTNLPRVGPYDDIVVVESDDERALIDWLNEHQYVVTPSMEPIIQQYVDEGSKFLALRLAADAGVGDIQPISFTCPPGVDGARIPLRLTAVSAEPEMGVLVFVAGPGRFQPATFRGIDLDSDLVQVSSASGQLNYYPLISWLVDEEGGKAFVTEYAGDAEDARTAVVNTFSGTQEDLDFLSEVFNEHAYVTRMYTRISGWEMDEDPVFLPSSGPDVSRVHDLSARPAEEVCANATRVACGDTYCGPDALCATTELGVDGCECPAGTVARQVTAPTGPTVFCQKTSFEMLGAVAGLGDPCAEATCGEHGRCQAVNGFPACACDDGFAAVVDPTAGGSFQVRCAPISARYPPDQLLWIERAGQDDAVAADTGCVSAPGRRAGGFLAFLALFVGAVLGVGRALRAR